MISIYFYDRDQSGIADIEVETMLRRRWDGERRRSTDVQIDDKSKVRERWRVDDRIRIWLTQISWTVSLIINGCF